MSNNLVRIALNGHYAPMNTQDAANAYVNAGFGYTPSKAKEDMLMYFDTKEAPMRKSKEVNAELVAERLANRPRPISELNRMELQREDEEPANNAMQLSIADSPWNDPRMALAKYEYVWHGNLEPMRSIFTEYESKRKESAMKEEQARQKELIELSEKQSEKKRLENEYSAQMIEVDRAKKQYEQTMQTTDSKAKGDAKIALDAEVAKLNLIGNKLGYDAYVVHSVEETPAENNKNEGQTPLLDDGDDNKPAKQKYYNDVEQKRIKDNLDGMRKDVAKLSASAEKVAKMKEVNAFIKKHRAHIEGGLGDFYSDKAIRDATPGKTYNRGKSYTLTLTELKDSGGPKKWSNIIGPDANGKFTATRR